MALPGQNNTWSDEWLCSQTRGDHIEFEWTIKNFHLLPHRHREAIWSQSFPYNNSEQWNLCIYPQGYDMEDAGWISVFLYPASEKVLGMEIKYEITIFRLKETFGTIPVIHKFEQMGGSGFRKLVETSKLLLINDPMNAITIRCKIEILGTYVTRSSGVNTCNSVVPFEVRRNRLTEDFQSFYKNSVSCDFTIISRRRRFPTHKAILASRSPVFAAMIQHKEVTEDVKNELKIEHMEPAVVGGLLEFIYTDDVSEIRELADGLLVAAERYGLEGLKNLCEETLYKTLNLNNAAKLLALADLHNARQLKKYVMQFIVANAKYVFQSEAFKSMKLSEELSKEIIRALTFPRSENNSN